MYPNEPSVPMSAEEDPTITDAEPPSPDIAATLTAAEKKVLTAFEGRESGVLTPEEIMEFREFSGQVEVMNALSWLRSKRLVTMKEVLRERYSLGKEGSELLKTGTPEWIAVNALARAGTGAEWAGEEDGVGEGSAGSEPDPSDASVVGNDSPGSGPTRMKVSELGPLLGKRVSVAVGWLRKKQWAEVRSENGETVLILTRTGRQAVTGGGGSDPDAPLLTRLSTGLDKEEVTESEAPRLKELLTRKGVVTVHEVVHRQAMLTPQGREVVASGIELRPEVSALTPELISTGRWKDVDIRPYDITAFAPRVRRGTLHPLTVLLEEIREIFISMGFTEIEGDYVESCFWNMDALFIPQDHPARDMQDTFYLGRPRTVEIEDAELMEKIRSVHENGGGTGSTGWQYRWSRTEAERALLRTHTTVNTIRYLSRHPDPPVKVFSLGRVFRKEAIDSTHLPEFHQIEGICMEEGASFGMLIGLLREFYARMGFREIRFRPGYFPYTEPSMEVEVFFNGRWLELGGSGIFREEVTAPHGVRYPVLAWGLGLERLAMLRLGLKDIRNLYVSDIEWLQEAEGKL